jgi:hypothetical protein
MRERIFVNGHQAGPPALCLMASLRVGGGRFDGNWYDLQTGPDEWTYAWLDELVTTCHTLGLIAYVTIGYTPPWINPDRSALPPLHDWQQFCLNFAQHFKGRITYVGCWNEWSGLSKDYVARLLRPMAEIFRATDPQYQICGPDIETERDWPERLAEVLTRGGDCLDIVTVHAYEQNVEDLWAKLTKSTPPRPKWLPQAIPWFKPSIQQVIQQSGMSHKPCWLTETGIRSDRVGEEGQGQWWDQFLHRLQGTPWPHGVGVFQLLDEQPPEQESAKFGVCRMDFSLKPAALVIQRYTQPGVA